MVRQGIFEPPRPIQRSPHLFVFLRSPLLRVRVPRRLLPPSLCARAGVPHTAACASLGTRV